MESWGRYPRARQTVETMRWRNDVPRFGAAKVLPRGQGRSYGDSCLNDGGVLISTAGLLSFPRKGFTLALDFPNRGPATLSLLDELEREVRDVSGALYPAKDARMSRETFVRSSPRLEEFLPFIDPAFSSSFWRRVTA